MRGPAGAPPLRYERTLAAHAEDGRWRWEESGEPFPFEVVERYRARRIRDRFDRELLLSYLEALGIPAGDDHAYRPGVVLHDRTAYPDAPPPRVVTLTEARAELA